MLVEPGKAPRKDKGSSDDQSPLMPVYTRYDLQDHRPSCFLSLLIITFYNSCQVEQKSIEGQLSFMWAMAQSHVCLALAVLAMERKRSAEGKTSVINQHPGRRCRK